MMRSPLPRHQAVFAVVALMVLLLNVSVVVNAYDDVRSQKAPAAGPVHPRVNINWTEQSANANLTRTERKNILRNKLVLTKLVVLNRHGHRAPNAPYWQMCPNDAFNRKRYDVMAEDLSGLGMQEEYHFGQYIHGTYRNFIGDKFNRSLHYFRAVGEPRILQSAMAVAQGIFPDGFGPGGFLPSRPQFVPIFSDMDTHEYLLDDVPCFRRAEKDSHRWLNASYPLFLKDPYNSKVIASMKKLCGAYNGTAKGYAYIKTIADGLTFNTDLGLNVLNGKLTPRMLFDIRNVSLQLLMQRLYNTDEQQTYTVVDLPRSVLQVFNHTHIGDSPAQLNDFYDTRQESNFYFVHREALYAFAQFFGFQYNVAGLPPGEVPVAASLIMEKLMPLRDQYSHDEKKIYIRITLWTPYKGSYSIPISKCRIPELCELRELRNIYDERVKRTGTWEALCNYKPQEIDHTTDIR
ncbi:putative acid phosphatase [Leptomonas seymouri]|uniref:Putative acid phosphatase n=1 Tax=Leptomonas seymouri TaxID=5684 RepID=A0A0N1IKN6_LEPSE|nr:putative acid phosphatase [Leptomonas seymouri]|eukprot:KPI87011.1 putative acid phosphatase [Leptomonas seymouri]